MHDLSLHQSQFNSQTADRIYFRDRDFRLISANQAFLNDLRCQRLENVVGTRLNEISAQSDGIQRLLVEAEEKISQTHTTQKKERVRCAINNTEAFVSLECHPVFSNDGKFQGIACRYCVQGFADHLGFETVLIDALMKSTQDNIYFKDVNSRFIRVSNSMVERLGAPNLESILGTTDFDYWNFECAQGFFECERRIMETREPVIGVCEKEIRTDGKTSWVITSKMPLEDEFGNVFGTFGISKDISDLKETEFELQKTNEKLLAASRRAGMAEIASNVIHNVGNVLNSVNVSLSLSRTAVKNSGVENLLKAADLLKHNANDPEFLSHNPKGKILPDFLRMSAESLAEMRSSVLDELEHLGRNLDHIKTIVSMQQQYAGVVAVTETVSVIQLVEDAVRIGECTLSASNVGIQKDFVVDIEADIDKHRVLQILVNLIRNAKHACEDAAHDQPKTICVTIDQPTDDFFMVEVSDNGVGIDEKNLTSIFNHGFTTKDEGKGFGLHSSANAAKDLGGSLIATSPGKGKGAAFVLNLPIKHTPRTDAKLTEEVTSIGKIEPEMSASAAGPTA